MIYSRDTYTTENLQPSDFRLGLGFDFSILHKLKVLQKKESYYWFTFTAIDGTLCEKRHHPILGLKIQDKRDGEIGIIESLHKHWLSGYYWVIVYRKLGTKSHGTLFIKNINSISDVVINSIEEFNKNYIFLEEFVWEQEVQ
jgi:hypothetical protein